MAAATIIGQSSLWLSKYVGLALRQYHRNIIDEEQLGEYLDTKPRNLQTLEDYFAEGGRDVRL